MRLMMSDQSILKLLFWFTVMISLALSMNALALSFDSGSDGSDGALDFTWKKPASGNQWVWFDPNDASTFDPNNPTRKLDSDNDNVFHFTSIKIPAGVTVGLTAPKLNWAPVYWLATNDIIIERGGVLWLGGGGGHGETSIGEGRFPSIPGPGGFPGGVGASAINLAQPGFGPGGGQPDLNGANGGGASHSTMGGSFGGQAGNVYGSPFLIPLVGGSGGAGGGNGSNTNVITYGGGGAGGGAILLASSSQIVIDGGINASGGAGVGGYRTRGGGGSGGSIRILAPVVKGNEYYAYDGSWGWMSVGGGDGANSANAGAAGRIRIETFKNQFYGKFFPDNALAVRVGGLVPSTPFLPSHDQVPGWPIVHVVSINGNTLNTEPTASFEIPDATVSTIDPVPVIFETKNIPTTANLKLHIYGPDYAPIEVQPNHTEGDKNSSTWQADVSFPVGVSRGYLQATWMP